MPISPKSRNQVVRSWEEALQLVDGSIARTVAPNTRAEYVYYERPYPMGPYVQICLHGHPIIRFYPDRIEFSDAGHPTRTTKDRLNRFLPARIYQRDGHWYVNNYSRPMPTSDYYGGRIAWTTIDYSGSE